MWTLKDSLLRADKRDFLEPVDGRIVDCVSLVVTWLAKVVASNAKVEFKVEVVSFGDMDVIGNADTVELTEKKKTLHTEECKWSAEVTFT